MPCTNPIIPEYLWYENQVIYVDADFGDDERMYRLTKNENPIEFPSTLTAYSCNWSRIIREEDILTVSHNEELIDFRTAPIQSLRGITIAKYKPENPHSGWHKLSCAFIHTPNECNYSHSEILIRHEIFSDMAMNQLVLHNVYSYNDWQNKTQCLLTKGGIFKELRGDYRLELIRVFL